MKKSLVLIALSIFLLGCAASSKLVRLQPSTLMPYEQCLPKINYVTKGSQADKAGLKAGDVLRQVDERKITNLSEAYTSISSIYEKAIVRVKRDGKDIEVKLKTDGKKEKPSGIVLYPERFTHLLAEGYYSDNVIKEGVVVTILFAVAAENNPLTAIGLMILNDSEEDIAIYPDNILFTDGNNSILKMFGGKVIASNVAQSAEKQFDAYDRTSAAYVAQAQSQPTGYTVTGSSQTYGSGNIYSYGNYGTLNYSGTSFSSYQVTPQPNFSAAGAALGRAIGLWMARCRLNRQQKLAENLYMNSFEFGKIPNGVNRGGVLYCQTPVKFPLKIKIVLNNKEHYFEWDKPKEE